MSQVPAATRALRVLRFLAGQPDPVSLDRIMRACELPRSTTYHLLNAMIEEGFVVHLPDEHRYGLGLAAFEIGSGYARQEPLQRLARPPLVTDVGVRLPAHLTASGRAVLARLPASQVRALYSMPADFVDRTGLGPRSLSALRTILSDTRQRGYAIENGEVTTGLASVAVAVLDHNQHPVAAVAVTYPEEAADVSLAEAVAATATQLTGRISGVR